MNVYSVNVLQLSLFIDKLPLLKSNFSIINKEEEIIRNEFILGKH